jgi:hypothetical protein
VMSCSIFIMSWIWQNTTTQSHSYQAKPTGIERRVQPCSIQEASRAVTFDSLPTPTGLSSRVHAVLLFNSHTSYISMEHTAWEYIICEFIVICLDKCMCLVLWILTFISIHNVKGITE